MCSQNEIIIDSIQNEFSTSLCGIKKLFLRAYSDSKDIDMLINILQIVEVRDAGVDGAIITLSNGMEYKTCTRYDQIKYLIDDALDLQWIKESLLENIGER